MTYLSIYFAGILSFFSPCILPIIPVYFSILTGTHKLINKAIMFCIGFSTVFALLGGGAGVLGSFIRINKGAVDLVAGTIILLLGLKFINVIQIPFLDRSYSINFKKFQTRFELLNAFIIGLLFAVTWSPCIGAILGGILTYVSVSSGGGIIGAIKLFLYGIGISTPLIVSVFFYNKIAQIYKSSPYFFNMVTKLLGALLILFAVNLFSNVVTLTKQSSSPTNTDKIMTPHGLPLFISFVSSSCEDCQTMKTIIDSMQKNCGKELIEFRTVDLNDNQYGYLAFQYGIYGTPTYLLLDPNGKEILRLFGSQNIDDLNSAIKKLTGKKCF